jgi:hypothetical protein
MDVISQLKMQEMYSKMAGGVNSSPAVAARYPLDHDGDGRPGGSLPAKNRGLDELKVEAQSLGVKVDKRWGEARLLAEIEKARDAK